MHTLVRANTVKILNGELFYHYPELVALEHALDCMGCLAPVAFAGGAVGCRLATDRGRLLLTALMYLHVERPASAAEEEVLGEFHRAVASQLEMV